VVFTASLLSKGVIRPFRSKRRQVCFNQGRFTDPLPTEVLRTGHAPYWLRGGEAEVGGNFIAKQVDRRPLLVERGFVTGTCLHRGDDRIGPGRSCAKPRVAAVCCRPAEAAQSASDRYPAALRGRLSEPGGAVPILLPKGVSARRFRGDACRPGSARMRRLVGPSTIARLKSLAREHGIG